MNRPADVLDTVNARYARRWLALPVLCLSLLIASLDNTILNVALPTLIRKLGASDSELQWIVDSYILVFACLLLVAGGLADRVGRKRTYVAGLIIFMAGSTWAAFSGSTGLLIAARASMGVGAALIMPSTLSIITTMFAERRERQRAFGAWAATNGLGIALGPILGGLLLAHFWWGSVFLVNVPIIAVSLVCSLSLIPDSRNPDAGPPDLIGSALSICGLALLIWAVIEAPARGWSAGSVVGAGAGGLAVLALFVGWERVGPHPMLNLGFFRRRGFAAGIGTLALVMVAGGGAFFVLTQYLQFELGYSALQAGVRILPAAGMIVAAAPLAQNLVRALGTRVVVAAGLLLIAAGLWELAGTTTSSDYLRMLPFIIALGAGTGLVLPVATASVMDSLPSAHTGVGSAANSTFLQFGTALGVAVIGSVLATRYQHRMVTILAPFHVPHVAENAILGSLGGALAVAARVGGAGGLILARLARASFISGMDLGLRTGAVITLAIALGSAFAFPARPAVPVPATPPQAREPDSASRESTLN
jgi:EmrB/QacA subfamily drug resistance transporter